MFRVGFAGTAKNTGKTTALMYFLRRASIRGEQVGLTGIGYDGEEIDHLTGLVKPRLKCPAGTLIVTAKGCLDRMTATYRIIGKLPLSNALGQLLLLKTISPGTVVVAGPNSGKDLRLTMDFFQRAGCELVLVDGAFGRLGPFVEVDGLILATGAARSANIINLVEDTRAFSRVFASFPSGKGGNSGGQFYFAPSSGWQGKETSTRLPGIRIPCCCHCPNGTLCFGDFPTRCRAGGLVVAVVPEGRRGV